MFKYAALVALATAMPTMGVAAPTGAEGRVRVKDVAPPSVGLGHAIIPATREDYSNNAELWKGDWAKYRAAHPNDQDCSISESDNWKGAQQCSQSWECRGARLCERGGWCSGYDGCEGTPLPDQAPGLLPDH